ncbi:MAG TPA: hypothetical protein VF484_11135 [Candidatus Limnocylindrales bacterium]
MVEYGTGISHGPAGQVSGSGGGTPTNHATSVDLGSQVSGFWNDATHTFSTLPFAEQVLIVVVGLFILYLVARRAF